MSDLIKNPVSFEEGKIQVTEPTKRSYFITKEMASKEINLHYEVESNQSFELTFVDLADCDLNFEINVDMKEGSTVRVYVASLDLNGRNKTYKVNVNHNEGHTFSRTTMAGINAGKGKLELLGNSYIANGAHKSDTRQEGKITNLSADAKSNVSPALLIKDNDVNASHGAALGAYNPDELYYLMSRGLSMDESKKLITFGSLLPIIETLHDEIALEEVKEALGALSL